MLPIAPSPHALPVARRPALRVTGRRQRLALALVLLACAGVGIVALLAEPQAPAPGPALAEAGQPALSVAVTHLQTTTLPTRVFANGDIGAWQEASIGTEANGLRLVEVAVNVGDRVKRGQVLARFASQTIEAELAHSRATAEEAQEVLVEASANGQRARTLQESGALSAQQIQQYLSAERTAQARLDAARAMVRTQQLRLAQTQVLAPDDGVISARTATLGAVLPAGQELFRLIRGGRIEWRAQVSAADLVRLQPGQPARVTGAGGEIVEGRLRILSPMVDPQTRNGLVYVDLPPSAGLRAGMFARGEFDLGSRQAQTLPQRAVQMRDGFDYVLRIGADSRVTQSKVSTGQRAGERVEILDGLSAEDRVVASGAAFLGEGDRVQVVADGGSAQ
ncbi:efflux RND transporter periplasmic adaptor subunit [Pseudomonas sp. NPDC089554]|uniref:efflux RND transporter periplasmic adaptor subunit n=1 Tax=Pseudomonas sp. NPDC089554 TaxID=3390653 RepID=UPI003D0731F5